MKFGAQLFSLREQGKTPVEIREVFRRMKEMGYQMVQVSGLGPIDPYELRDISQEFELPIPITHTPLPRLQEDLDAVIREHRIFGCPVIGLGAMPKTHRDGTVATFMEFKKEMDVIQAKIRDAGLRFAYHNHAFEFSPLENGRCMFDYLAEECDWDMIADVCWIHLGGRDVPTELRRLKGRLMNAHLKDVLMPLEDKNFCPLGQGVVDLKASVETLKECGCENAYVEQDNATKKSDPFAEMAASAQWLKDNGCL